MCARKTRRAVYVTTGQRENLPNIDGQIAGIDEVTLPEVFSLGQHAVGLDVTDSRGGVGETTASITVVDTTTPSLTASLTPTCIWPPDHKLVLYSFGSGIEAKASDVCDAAPAVHVVSVTSNQPALGGGSGNSTPDVAFGTGAFCVRAERDGTQSTDRVYTVTVEAADASGNKTQQQLTVRVPHDLGQGARSDCPNVDPSQVVDDGDPRCTQAAVDPPPPVLSTSGAPSSAPRSVQRLAAQPTATPVSASCAVEGVGHRSNALWAVFVACAAALVIRRRRSPGAARMLVLAAIFTLGCGKDGSSSPSIPNTPLSGTVGGHSITVSSARAQWSPDRSRVTVLVSSYSSPCGSASPAPAAGQTLTEIDVSVPRSQLQAGSHPISVDLSPGATNVGVGITDYSLDAMGKIQQSVHYIQGGTLRLDAVDDAKIAGGLAIDQGGTTISGTFTAAVCP